MSEAFIQLRIMENLKPAVKRKASLDVVRVLTMNALKDFKNTPTRMSSLDKRKNYALQAQSVLGLQYIHL